MFMTFFATLGMAGTILALIIGFAKVLGYFEDLGTKVTSLDCSMTFRKATEESTLRRLDRLVERIFALEKESKEAKETTGTLHLHANHTAAEAREFRANLDQLHTMLEHVHTRIDAFEPTKKAKRS